MRRDFERIAIVNRGEPAMRLIHAVREYNREYNTSIRTIALYTEPDRRAMFVREADEAVNLGSAIFVDEKDGASKNRYLDYKELERALVKSRAEAVWVGWGFVAEHAAFADLCERLGIVFIGPSGDVMRQLGDKITSKLKAEEAEVPVAPWSGGPVETLEDAKAHAKRLGYPLMVKATAGGGGRGIRKVYNDGDLVEAFESARAEALKGFGDATVFMERLMAGARHIEVQMIADGAGNAWGLGVRDCSLQRRHQKILEESPSPVLTEEQDAMLRAAAVRLGQVVGYQNAGTVEFLYDPDSEAFSFMEVNARLQVEHPVTEMTTGVDLVKLQIHVARGGLLEGEPPPQNGCAIEVRLNAEDPANRFAPAPGTVEYLRLPTGPGIRVDRGVEEGDVVPPEFDSMIAKFLAHGQSRAEALARLKRGLEEAAVIIRGGMSNKGFLLELLDYPEVQEGIFDVGWLDRLVAEGGHLSHRHAEVALLAAAIEAYEAEVDVEKAQFYASASRGRPEVKGEIGREIDLGYQGQTYKLYVYRQGPREYHIDVDSRRIDVVVEQIGKIERRLTCGGHPFRVLSRVHGVTHFVEVNGLPHRISRDEGGTIRAPSPAVVVSVGVKEGDEVSVGDRLVVLEAMKMELSVLATFPGRVREVLVRSNVQVPAGAPLLLVEPAEEAGGAAHAGKVSFDALGVPVSQREESLIARCRRNFAEVESLMLGYDVDPDEMQRALSQRGMICDCLAPDDAVMWRSEAAILNIFVDISALHQRQPGGDEALSRRSTEEYLFTYLRDLDAKGEKLPAGFIEKLERMLAHYDVDSLDRSPKLEESLFRIGKSHQRMAQQVGAVLSILQRHLDHRDALAEFADEDHRALLDRVIAETQGSFPAINDLAREVRYRLYAQPLLEQARREAYTEAVAHLAYLEEHPDAPDRAARIEALVRCPQPLKSLLSSRFETASSALGAIMLEVITRRYYRIRSLENVQAKTIEGKHFVMAEYDHEGKHVHTITTHAPYEGLAHAAVMLCPMVETLPEDHDIVVDFYLWKDGPLGDSEETLQEVLAVFNDSACPRGLRRIVVALSGPESGMGIGGTQHFTIRPSEDGYWEEKSFKGVLHRGLHPMMAKRLNLWRLQNFDIERLSSPEDVYLMRGVARDNPQDERLFGVAEIRDMTPVRDASGRVVQLPHLERMLSEVLAGFRHFQAQRPPRRRLHWNRILLYIWPPIALRSDEFNHIVHRLAPATEGLGIEAIEVHATLPKTETKEARDIVITISNIGDSGVVTSFDEPTEEPLAPLSAYEQQVLRLKRRGLVYPYELIKMFTPQREGAPTGLPPGSFAEYDLDENNVLVPVDRPAGQNTTNVVVGTIRNYTAKYPDGMERVIILGDPSRGMGNLAEAECRRINEAMRLAKEKDIPLEWFAVSAGAKIAMDSGTENMDWIALVLRRLVEFTQGGGEVNIIIIGINVGAQPYWNAEATMLMHTRGILIMTADAAMVLTGKQALDYSGGVSAEDNLGIGGYERIMGPNGQAQYFARDITEACHILLRYYDHTYVVPGERFPRRADTDDPTARDVRTYEHGRVNGISFGQIGEVFSDEKNPGRKKPFDVRRIMKACVDQDHEPLERWYGMEDAEIAVVWDAHIGGYPVCLLGLESRPLSRFGFIPADGPDVWTGGTLFPRSSKKVARAINAASGNRPVVVLANLSGFDGSPESLRSWQLEYGAEIGRAVVNFKGPIIFCVISRYHGGAFVVFSNALNENMEIVALEGTYASVIGGAPAAAVVFAREVKKRALADTRLRALDEEIKQAEGAEKVRLQTRREELFHEIHSEKLGQVADEFDGIHSVHRAQKVGSVQHIIPPETLRPYLIDAVERGMARVLDQMDASPALSE